MYTKTLISFAVAAMAAGHVSAVPAPSSTVPLTTTSTSPLTTITTEPLTTEPLTTEPLTTQPLTTTTTSSACASATPPSGQSYVSGFPLCGVAGFTQTLGNGNDCYKEIVFQTSGATLESCKNDCIHNSTCKSYAYAEKYGDCLFYDHVAEDIQLLDDSTSYFVHYDICCSV